MTTLTADSSLLAADPAVPTRDVLLDPRAAARRLEPALGGATIHRCERVRTKYRVGESLRVLYALTVGGRTLPVAARTFSASRGLEAYERALPGAAPAGPLPPVAHDPELGAVLWTFPNDRRIRDLPLLASPRALGELLGARCEAARLAAWVPETQATTRCLGAGGETLAYAKVYARDGAERPRRIARAIGGRHPTLRLPRLFAEGPRVLFFEPLSGAPLAGLRGARLERAMRRLGAGLATLHRLPVPAGAPRHDRLDGARLHTAAGIIGLARPELAGVAEALACRLEAEGDGNAAATACIHGDVHLANALDRPDGIALVDIDDVGAGAPEADLARVLAGLAYAAALGDLPADAERDLGRALLAGYGSASPPRCGGSLRWHVAATLLARHAATAVSRYRRRGLERLEAVLGRAGEELP